MSEDPSSATTTVVTTEKKSTNLPDGFVKSSNRASVNNQVNSWLLKVPRTVGINESASIRLKLSDVFSFAIEWEYESKTNTVRTITNNSSCVLTQLPNNTNSLPQGWSTLSARFSRCCVISAKYKYVLTSPFRGITGDGQNTTPNAFVMGVYAADSNGLIPTTATTGQTTGSYLQTALSTNYHAKHVYSNTGMSSVDMISFTTYNYKVQSQTLQEFLGDPTNWFSATATPNPPTDQVVTTFYAVPINLDTSSQVDQEDTNGHCEVVYDVVLTDPRATPA
jgi:hypothetical protein